MRQAAPALVTRSLGAVAAVLAAVCVVALAFAPMVEAQGRAPPKVPDFKWTRIEKFSGPYLTGSLTWDGSNGGIAWDASATTQATLQTTMAGTTRVFTSAAIPETLPLNASRYIEVDLRVQGQSDPDTGSSCAAFNNPRLDVELWAGTQLVGGVVHGQSYQALYFDVQNGRFANNPFPPDPPGWGTCRFRIHPEVAFLEKGTVLSLKVLHVAQSGAVTLGLGPDHASMLRIPYFSPEEAALRLTAPEPSKGTGGAGGGTGLLALLALPALFRPRRRSVLLVAILVAATGLSGCFGGAAGPGGSNGDGSGGELVATLSSQAPGNGTPSAFGSIVGQVHDADRFPIRDAHVVLVGSQNFTKTNAYGSFQITHVPPAAYTLRVDASGYISLERPVTVVKSAILKVDITLVPIDVKEGDKGRHPHDDWLQRTRVDLVDRGLGTECAYVAVSCRSHRAFTIPAAEKDDLIFPGTREVEVTVTWTAAEMGYPRAGLYIQANNDPEPGNWTMLYPRASGVPFRIQTTWELTDVGHQRFSTWNFELFTPDARDQVAQARQDAGLAKPEFRVKVTIHKGVVPLEPPHPDAWAGRNVITAFKMIDAQPTTRCAPPTVLPCPYSYVEAIPTSVVPYDAEWIEVTILPNVRPTTFEWLLRYKPADRPRDDAGVSPRTSASYVDAQGGVANGTGKTWKIALKDDEADGTYARKSAWSFIAHPDDELYGTEELVGTKFRFEAHVHRDPLPK